MGLEQYLYCNSKALCKDMTERMGDGWWFINDELGYNKGGMIGYWRKANAIQNFFVERCQDGNDDQREAYVSFDVLQDLMERCDAILKTVKRDEKDNIIDIDEKLCESTLPTTSGFFFGDTSYGEWYVGDLEYTSKLLHSMFECLEKVDDYRYVHPSDKDWNIKIYYGCWW